MVIAALLLDALLAVASDVVVGFGLIFAVAVVVTLVVRQEAERAKRKLEAELELLDEKEPVDAWAGFPPKWNPPEAETDFERREEAA